MIEYNRKLPLLSIHIPKCAGSSFEWVLRKWFGFGLKLHYKDHRRNKLPKSLGDKSLRTLLFRPICIHGHFNNDLPEGKLFTYYPDAKQFITILRDPLEAAISMYSYQKDLISRGGLYWNGRKTEIHEFFTIDEWISNRRFYLLNFFPWHLTDQNYQAVLTNNFVHIGITERLQRSVDILANKLGKRTYQIPSFNKSSRQDSPSEESVAIFKRNNKIEYEIYNFAVGLNE